MLTLITIALGFALGRIAPNVWDYLESLAEMLASPLPDTTVLPLSATQPIGPWAIAGEYLIRDNGVTRNVYLTRYARWLMGESADVVLLTPFRHRTAYIDSTPTGGKYIRWKRVTSYRAYVVSYWFPASPAYSTVGQASWNCEVLS